MQRTIVIWTIMLVKGNMNPIAIQQGSLLTTYNHTVDEEDSLGNVENVIKVISSVDYS
jgi:hypothetical protein